MKKLLLLFSHSLTPDQREDAQATIGVSEFVPLPPNLQQHFSNVPADLDDVYEYAIPVSQWVGLNATKGDYALVQGDFGLTYALVNVCKQFGIQPVYATTERQSIDTPQPDGSVKTERVFKHKRFRKY